MAIENYTGDLAAIDNTFGYNDYLITATGNAGLPTNVIDDLSGATQRARLSGASNASSFGGTTLSDGDAEAMARPGDRLFRLPNGGLLLRRSVFADPCSAGTSRPNNSLAISHELARSLAFFGDTYQGGDASGAGWCRRTVPGTAGTIETPWDVSSKNDLERIKSVLGRIASVRCGKIPSDLQPAQHTLAKELANAIPESELKAFSRDVENRLEAFEGFGDLYLKHPILHTLGIAILFGLGTDIYHLTRYALFGGDNPLKSGGKGLVTRLVKGIRDFFKKDPPQGGSGRGGGKELPRITPDEMPAGAQVSGGFVVHNGKTIGVASLKRTINSETVPEGEVVSGEINTHGDDLTAITPVPDFVHDWDNEPTREWEALPDGVVPLDEGAFIYRYQATVNGEIVGLSESVARNLAAARGLAFDADSFFSAGEFTSAELRQYAGTDTPVSLASSPDDTVRSLKLKGVNPLETGTAARLSSKDEAAAVAAERMTSGSAGRVTGFGGSGAGVRIPAPAVRVVPIPVVP